MVSKEVFTGKFKSKRHGWPSTHHNSLGRKQALFLARWLFHSGMPYRFPIPAG